MEDTIVFVDDGFFRLVKRYFQNRTNKRLKFIQTFRNICKKENLNLKHLFIYMAPPFQGKIPSDDEKERKRGYDNIKKMFDKKYWVTLREGRCQKIVDKNGGVIFNQKGVDSWIVADLCLFKENFPNVNTIILISSDSDFAPIIKMIREKKNIEVILYTYFEKRRRGLFYYSNHLLKVVSKWVKLDESFFEEETK